MTKIQAHIQARRYSDRYNTFWYVREVSPGVFQPYAHHSDDERTVATFYCGKEMKTQFEIEQSKVWTSFHILRRVIPHSGPKFEYTAFMDDFGFLVQIDFKALAIHLQEEGSSK